MVPVSVDDAGGQTERGNLRMPVVTMKELLESGVHFGHQTRRWNPKMKEYIFTERNGIYIVDLQKTVRLMDDAYNFIRDTVFHEGTVLFVGTKKQAQETIEEEADRCGMPYVNQRWLGGMLTNWSTIKTRIRRLEELEGQEESGLWDKLPKKEVASLTRERERLDKFLGGIRNMGRIPDAVYIVDPRKEEIAINECRRLGIPVVSIVDTNCDPDLIDYVIPGNDDAIRAVRLLTSRIADAVLEGRQGVQVRQETSKPGKPEQDDAPVKEKDEPVAAEVTETSDESDDEA